MRRQRVGGAIGSLHAWGKTWRGPEASGVGKSEATIHPCLRSLSQLLVSTYIKLGHAAGICAVAGNLIAFGRQWNTLESACRCQHFVLPQDLGETEAAGMWLEAYQLTGGRGSWSAGISIPAAPRRSWIRFPMQRLSGNLYVPGYLHGKVSTLLSRQAFHQECGGRRPTTFRIELKQSPHPGSEGRDAPVRGAFAVSCPCCHGQEGSLLAVRSSCRL